MLPGPCWRMSATRSVWVALVCLPIASASLAEAFSAFAECEGVAAREKLEKRLTFFAEVGAQSEQEVRALPEHQARNEQEAVLALQQRLLRPGAAVRLHALDGARAVLSGCNGTLLGCIRDGSFRCAVEVTECAGEWAHDGNGDMVRARVTNLRPGADCTLRREHASSRCRAAMALATDGPEEFNDGEPSKSGALDGAAVGQLMADALHAYERLNGRGELGTAARELGPTSFPDLPYAALVLVAAKLHLAACYALLNDDVDGAALAVDHALDLEESARAPATDMYELDGAVRAQLAELFFARSAVRAARGDEEGEREAMLIAQRLNASATLSHAKLELAHQPAQLAAPHALAGVLKKKSVRSLQRWFAEELWPLDGGREQYVNQ